MKTLSDADAARIDARPVDITIEDLVQLPRPARLSETRRASPVEFTVYRVEARLLGMFGESDRDYHLVLASLNDSAIAMIAEVPDPACSGSCASGRADIYAQVRETLMDHLDSPRIRARPRIRLTGVGFFDRLHGQRGVAPNGIELHPILSVQFCDQVVVTKAQWEQALGGVQHPRC